MFLVQSVHMSNKADRARIVKHPACVKMPNNNVQSNLLLYLLSRSIETLGPVLEALSSSQKKYDQ